MPEYLHPGVYIEETSFRGKPIQGVSTSTAGFVGRAQAGPEGRAVLVTNFNQFRRTFGDPYPTQETLGDYLGHAVRAFFENGGSRVYVVRVLAADALASRNTAGLGTVLRLPSNVTVRGPTDRIPLNSLRGVDTTSVLRVFTRPNAGAPFTELSSLNVDSYDAGRNTVTVNAMNALAPGAVLEPENTYFLVAGTPPQSGPVAGPVFRAKNRGSAGDQIAVQIRPVDLPPVRLTTRSTLRDRPLLHTLAATLNVGDTQVELPATALARVRSGDRLAIGSEEVTVADVTGTTVSFTPTAIAGSGFGDYSAGRALLVSRGGTAAPQRIPLPAAPNLGVGGPFVVGTAAANIAFPHDLAASLTPGDVVLLEVGPLAAPTGSVTLTVDAVTFASGAPNVTFSALTAQQTNPPIRLVSTSNGSALAARVIVADVSGFTAPFRAGSFETIAISDGSTREEAEVLLVHPMTRTLLLSKAAPAAPGRFASTVTPDNWLSLESLQLGSDGQTTFQVASTSSFYSGAKVEFDSGTVKHELVVASVDPAARTVTTTSGLALGANTFIDAPAAFAERAAYLRTAEIEIQVLQSGVVRETFSGLSWNSDTTLDSYRRYYVTRINDPESGSQLVDVELVPPPPAGTDLDDQPTTDNGYPLWLTGGTDGSALTAVDLIGKDNGPGKRTGTEALAERDDIAIVAVPGVTEEAVQGALLSHCERLRYRIAVLDGRIGQSDVSAIQAHRNNYDSKYGAYYAPWLKTLDISSGKTILVPPSGYAAGIYARSDAERGVHKAPANEVVRNILDVEFPFTAGEQDVLNPIGVNLIRDLTPRGIRIWGARTVSSDQEWKYVNVRRLFIFLEHSIDLGTQWVVFEPNNETLWARVTETITSFLTGVWKTGALMGTTPDEAFFVRCDRSTMTQDDLDNGRLICEIGVAPTMPAEFVIFRIGQFTASAPS